MTEYFYTLDMGHIYGPKLQSLAVQASFDDVEAFAAMILADAIDDMAQRLAGVDQNPVIGPGDSDQGWRPNSSELDDDIPW